MIVIIILVAEKLQKEEESVNGIEIDGCVVCCEIKANEKLTVFFLLFLLLISYALYLLFPPFFLLETRANTCWCIKILSERELRVIELWLLIVH